MKNDHPIFGDAEPDAWVDFEEINGCADPELLSLIQTDREEIVRRAVHVLVSFLDKTAEEFQHEPELAEFQIRFLHNGRSAFQAYLQFTFTAHLTQNRPESDSWWVIVACPEPFRFKRYNVWHLGWYCQ